MDVAVRADGLARIRYTTPQSQLPGPRRLENIQGAFRADPAVVGGRAVVLVDDVMHGADDPHPFLGVRDPLAAILPDCRFLLLPHCGHTPWLERRAKDRFFQLLGEELLLVP